MLLLPAPIIALLAPFAPLFSRRVWRHVPTLVAGALLAPGRRMVSSALRAVGLAHEATFQTYHRVLNRARWSSLGASRILFHLLVTTFAPHGPLVVGLDETIERRRSAKIHASGIYRDPVRSSRSHFVKVRGLRWICAMLLVPIPWARVGVAVSQCACALRAVDGAAAAALQAADDLGAPDDPPTPSLGAPAAARRRG